MDPLVYQSLLATIFLRAAERILLVIVGASAIFLGYRLFMQIPNAKAGEGKIELPGGISIFLTRIGPGVFFALFGAGIVAYSVAKPVEFKLGAEVASVQPSGGEAAKNSKSAANSGSAISWSGVSQGAAAAAAPAIVATLNGFVETSRGRLDAARFGELEKAVRAAKLALMLRGWNSEWGDPREFEKWVSEANAADPPPDAVLGAVSTFRASIQ